MDGLQGALRAQVAKPLHLCPNCSAYVVAATWAERVSERRVRNIWCCEVCRCEFETSAYFSDKPTSESATNAQAHKASF
jgi:ribosomal protein L37AE/L43A